MDELSVGLLLLFFIEISHPFTDVTTDGTFSLFRFVIVTDGVDQTKSFLNRVGISSGMERVRFSGKCFLTLYHAVLS